jgi:hypothetical protein
MRQGLVTPITGSLENRVDNVIDSAYHSKGDVNPDHPETVGAFDIFPNTGDDAKRIIVVLDRRLECNGGGGVAARHEFKTKGDARSYILGEMRAPPAPVPA